MAAPVATPAVNVYQPPAPVVVEKTLLAPAVNADSWIGQAVALVVIYRWYAPQLATKYELIYPQAAEDAALAHLRTLLHWPLAIFTE